MLTHCLHWELGHTAPPARELTQRLQKLSHTEALLVLSKTSFPADWEQAHFCTLVNGPSRFIRGYFVSQPPPPQLDSQRQEHANWLAQFRQLRESARAGYDWLVPSQRLQEEILGHLDWEEERMFPLIDRFLQNSRPTREMLYEHQGIRRFLPGLQAALRCDGTQREWERFALDLIHLVEHHIEHEENGLYPLYERLLKGGKGDR